MEDHGDWVLVTDDNSETRVWSNLNAAMEKLLSEGWQVVLDPARIQFSLAELDRFDLGDTV